MSHAVGVLGATGLVGQRLVARLADHPTLDLVAVAASGRRAGERYGDAVTWRIDEPLPADAADRRLSRATPSDLAGEPDLVLSALPGEAAAEVEPTFAAAGALVCSNASPRRMDDDVPLVIPEINAAHLSLVEHQRRANDWDGAIVKNPNCMATTVTLPLAALQSFGLESATVVTLQAISGAGTTGVHAVDAVGNLLPDIPGEADKLASEPRKLLGEVRDGRLYHHAVDIDAACHRVPVVDGHLATCFVDLAEAPDPAAVAEALTAFPAAALPSAPAQPIVHVDKPRRPRPRYDRDVGDGMAVAVGPIRETGDRIAFTCLAHNTVRGAAGACLLAAEAAVEAGYLA